MVHLGIETCINWSTLATLSSELIQKGIKLGRNTAYVCMGTGLHGSNGLNPIVPREIVQLHVVPRMIYELESQVLSKT